MWKTASSIGKEHTVDADVEGCQLPFGAVLAHLLYCQPTLATGVEIDLVCALREGPLPGISYSVEQDHDRERKVGGEEILGDGLGIGVHAANGPDSLCVIG